MDCTAKRPLHLYLNIPFCPARCAVCNQRVYIAGEAEQRAYAAALVREMEAAAPDFGGSCVQSVCIGGGSPAALPEDVLASLIRRVRALYDVAPDAEITVQAAPNQVNASLMVLFQNAGVNRLETGLVTGRQRDCDRLGLRWNIPSAQTVLMLPQVFSMKHYAASILFGLPGQTQAQFGVSLRFAVKYNAPEILLSRFAQPTGEAWTKLPACGEALPEAEPLEAMLAYAREHLAQKGYREYLPLCFARPGFESRHLIGRESGEDYLSFGAGTLSRTDGIVYSTTDNLRAYMNAPDDPAAIYTVRQRT